MQFASPTHDLGFKKLFADPKNKSILIGFLNSMLERTGDARIADAIVSDANNLPLVNDDRHSIMDVRCTDERGRQYIVEVQREDEKDFRQRCVYLSSRVIAAQLKEHQLFKEVVPVIFLGILNFKLFDGDDYISHHMIMNSKTHEVVLDALEWHFAELKKFEKREQDIKTDVDRWLYLLKNAIKLDHVPSVLRECKETSDAMRVLDKHTWTKPELARYDLMIDEARVAQSVLETALEKREAKGEARGVEKVAKQMLAEGCAVALIQKVTGLSAEEIAKLK